MSLSKPLQLGLLLICLASSGKAQQNTLPGPPPVQPGNANFLRTNQVLGIPDSFCGHVIDLMMRNQRRRQTANVGEREIYLPHLSVGVKPGDLEMTGLNLVCEASEAGGPVFQVAMRNNSDVPIGNFQVSLVGVLGQIQIHSPTANIRIPKIESGQTVSIQLQLPIRCMTMGQPGGQTPFDTLIVALDSCDELLECNELNNVLIIRRCEVPLLVTASAPPPESQNVPAPPVPENQVPQTVPELAPETSPLDQIDVDQLQPGTADSAATN